MDSPHADNTIVVLLTDHGFHLGEDNRFGKSTLWEQAALVPLIVYDPEDRKPRERHDPVALLDVGPTVLDYVGLPPLDGCIGHSLRPMVSDQTIDQDRAVATFNHHGASVRKGKYRFIRYVDGSSELFDLEADWWQQRNLGPDHQDYAMMAQAHEECCREYGSDLSVIN
jgi:arylsulfatase A-like enzyme